VRSRSLAGLETTSLDPPQRQVLKVKKVMKGLVIAALVTASVGAMASGGSPLNQRLEQAAEAATSHYAQDAGKPMPQLEDYRYGMKLDVAKLVYSTPGVQHCGNVQSMMSYEDSQGDLHMLRYLVDGECHSNR
jgi:hypothetical protein